MIHDNPSRVTVARLYKSGVLDPEGESLRTRVSAHLGFDPGVIYSGKLFVSIDPIVAQNWHACASEVFQDKVLHDLKFNDSLIRTNCTWCVCVAKLPGVTDDEGMSAGRVFSEMLAEPSIRATQKIFSQELWWFENDLSEQQVERIAKEFLGNTFVQKFIFAKKTPLPIFIPDVKLSVNHAVDIYDLNQSPSALLKLSKENLWSLDEKEMCTISSYFASDETRAQRTGLGLPLNPTDCEMEIIAQTWSEHCKHKEFAAKIKLENKDTGETKIVDGLFDLT